MAFAPSSVTHTATTSRAGHFRFFSSGIRVSLVVQFRHPRNAFVLPTYNHSHFLNQQFPQTNHID